MDIEKAKSLYNARGGVSDRNDPAKPSSNFSIERIQKQLKEQISPGMRVLDLGCNAGRYTFAVEKLGGWAVGIDCAEQPLTHAMRLKSQWNSHCDFLEGDLLYLPFPQSSFDLALFPLNIVEFSYSGIDKLCSQLMRILKPGGKFCVEMRDSFIKSFDHVHPKHYDPLTGCFHDVVKIPHWDEVQYPTYFWTVAFAKQMIGRYFSLICEEQVQDNLFWLVFQNQSQHFEAK